MSTVTTPVKPEVDPLVEIPTLPEEPNVPEEVALLRRARDLIARRRRWIKGHEYAAGAVCSMGAINLAYDDNWYIDDDDNSQEKYWYAKPTVVEKAYELLASVIPEPRNYGAFGNWDEQDSDSKIVLYNDNDSRRKHQVIKKFNEAIQKGLTRGDS